MKKLLFFSLIAIFITACNGPIDAPSDAELKDMIETTFEKEMGGTFNFFNLFSNKNKGNKSMFTLEKLENLKRADWEGGKQKFKADATMSMNLNINIPNFDFEELFDDGDVNVEFNKMENTMTTEIQGYLYKDEFDDWVVEFVD